MEKIVHLAVKALMFLALLSRQNFELPSYLFG